MSRKHRFSSPPPAAPTADAVAPVLALVTPIGRSDVRLCRVVGTNVVYLGRCYPEGTEAHFPQVEIDSLPGVLVVIE